MEEQYPLFFQLQEELEEIDGWILLEKKSLRFSIQRANEEGWEAEDTASYISFFEDEIVSLDAIRNGIYREIEPISRRLVV
jgi:hypothetical protein